MSLRTAYQRLRGVEAVLGAKTDRYPSLEVQESALAKFWTIYEGAHDGAEEGLGEVEELEDDPATVAFFRALRELRERLDREGELRS